MNHGSIRRGLVLKGVFLLVFGGSLAQSWQIPYRSQAVQVDGLLDEWVSVPALYLTPGQQGVKAEGTFKPDDLSVVVRALWDEDSLYVALDWKDDLWDVKQVRRSEAVFVTADKRRRDRMLFYDYFKFQIESLKYDYLMWLSPRVNDQGPYYWQRRREGLGSMEGATSPPVITPRQDGQRVTVELLFSWRELRLKPKRLVKDGLPLSLTVSDSDLPGYLEDSKIPELKWLDWGRTVTLLKK